MIEATKNCPKCNKEKTLDSYYKSISRKSKFNLQSWCKDCTNKSAREYSSHKTDGIRTAGVTAYGISVDKYLELMLLQDNKCAICKEATSTETRLYIDHDHNCCSGRKSCGKCVRGLLCRSCNSALGLFKEDKNNVREALEYLSKEKVC